MLQVIHRGACVCTRDSDTQIQTKALTLGHTRHKERHQQSDTQDTHKDTNTRTHRHKQRHRHSDTQKKDTRTNRHKQGHRHSDTHTQTKTPTLVHCTHRLKQRHRHSYTQTKTKTPTLGHSDTNKDTDTRTHRLKQRHRHSDTNKDTHSRTPTHRHSRNPGGILSVFATTHVISARLWRRPIGYLQLQTIFRESATNYRVLVRNKACKDKASYGSSPPCTRSLDITRVCLLNMIYYLT